MSEENDIILYQTDSAPGTPFDNLVSIPACKISSMSVYLISAAGGDRFVQLYDAAGFAAGSHPYKRACGSGASGAIPPGGGWTWEPPVPIYFPNGVIITMSGHADDYVNIGFLELNILVAGRQL